MDPYLTLKFLHILSSTVLFGTGMGTAFQMVWAWRSARVETIHSVASGVVVADWVFTTPAGIIQPLTGYLLISQQGYDWNAPWLLLTYALYGLAFVCWAPVVHLQIRIRDMAASALATGTPLPRRARRYFNIWFALGWPAFIALVVIYWLMVNRPDLGV